MVIHQRDFNRLTTAILSLEIKVAQLEKELGECQKQTTPWWRQAVAHIANRFTR